MVNVQPLKFLSLSFQQGGKAFIGRQPFTGIVRDVLKNGDHVEHKYVNGLITEAKRTGKKSFAKLWKREGNKTSIFTYNADFYVNQDHMIKGKIDKITSIYEKNGSLVTIKDPSGLFGKYKSIINQSGDRMTVMSQLGVNNIYENGKLLFSEGTGHNLDGYIKYYDPLNSNGIWATGTKEKLNGLFRNK